MLERIEQTIEQIRQCLLNDETYRRLMFNDGTDALTSSYIPTVVEVDKYVLNRPIYEFTNKADYTQNGMTNIYLGDTEYTTTNGNTMVTALQITIVFNIDKWQLNGGKVRPISAANRVIELLHNKKFSVSNPIEFDSMTETIANKQLVGYTLLFAVIDGSNKLENF